MKNRLPSSVLLPPSTFVRYFRAFPANVNNLAANTSREIEMDHLPVVTVCYFSHLRQLFFQRQNASCYFKSAIFSCIKNPKCNCGENLKKAHRKSRQLLTAINYEFSLRRFGVGWSYSDFGGNKRIYHLK